MLTEDVKARLSDLVPALNARVKLVADFAAIKKTANFQGPLAASVLPLGLRKRSGGDAAVNAFTQMLDEVVGIVLTVRVAGNSAGDKGLPTIEDLIDGTIAALCGWGPETHAGVFVFERGALIDADAGLISYQIDVSIQKQVRNLS